MLCVLKISVKPVALLCVVCFAWSLNKSPVLEFFPLVIAPNACFEVILQRRIDSFTRVPLYLLGQHTMAYAEVCEHVYDFFLPIVYQPIYLLSPSQLPVNTLLQVLLTFTQADF